MARTEYKIFDNSFPHFITCTIVDWHPIFEKPQIADILISSLKFLQKENRITIYAYVIMSDHIHLIAKSENLQKEAANFKSFTARQIIDYLKDNNFHDTLNQFDEEKMKRRKGRNYQIWQEGTHPQIISSESIMKQKIEYIHNNPVKAGLVDDLDKWKFSSAVNYSGKIGVLDVNIDW